MTKMSARCPKAWHCAVFIVGWVVGTAGPAYLISILSALRLSFGVGSSQKLSWLDLMLGFKVLLALAADHVSQMDARLHDTLECIGWRPFRNAQSLFHLCSYSVEHACFAVFLEHVRVSHGNMFS